MIALGVLLAAMLTLVVIVILLWLLLWRSRSGYATGSTKAMTRGTSLRREASLLTWTANAVWSIHDEKPPEPSDAKRVFARHFEYYMLQYLIILLGRADEDEPRGPREGLVHYPGPFFVRGARASFWIPSEDGKELEMIAGVTPPQEMFRQTTLPMARSFAGGALRAGHILVHPYDEGRAHYAAPKTEDRKYGGGGSILCIPLSRNPLDEGNQRCYGVLCIDSADKRAFAKARTASVNESRLLWIQHIAETVIGLAACRFFGDEEIGRMENRVMLSGESGSAEHRTDE